MPSEEDQRQVQKWRNRRIREESRATYEATKRMPIIQKGIEERAPLNRIRQGMLRLARGTRKHIRPKRRRSTRRRSTRRRTKRRRTNRRRYHSAKVRIIPISMYNILYALYIICLLLAN